MLVRPVGCHEKSEPAGGGWGGGMIWRQRWQAERRPYWLF